MLVSLFFCRVMFAFVISLMLRTLFRQPSDFVLFIALCCTFRFVDLARIVFVLCLFVLFAGVSAMPPIARMTSEQGVAAEYGCSRSPCARVCGMPNAVKTYESH